MKKRDEKVYKIYLFRHGQTFYNKRHIFTGWKDSKLTPLGIKQAKIIAKKLKNKKIDIAFTSDLSRCKDTLKEVLKFHKECKKVIVDKRLRERSYGKLQGMSHKRLVEIAGKKKYNVMLHWHKIDLLYGKEKKKAIEKLGQQELKVIRRSYDVRPPDGESIKMVEKRVLSFIKDLLEMIKKEKVNVVISASGNSMRPFRRYFEKVSIEQMMKWEMPYDDYFEYSVKV